MLRTKNIIVEEDFAASTESLQSTDEKEQNKDIGHHESGGSGSGGGGGGSGSGGGGGGGGGGALTVVTSSYLDELKALFYTLDDDETKFLKDLVQEKEAEKAVQED